MSERPPRRVPRSAWALAVVLWPQLGVIPETFRITLLADAILALSNTIIAASLVLLTGWVGQISLAQASFVGIGAFVTGLVTRGWGLAFPFSMLVAAGGAAFVAAALGLVALRVRGLYLAVATLMFAWMTDRYLFLQSRFVGAGGASSIEPRPLGRKGGFPFIDLTDRRTFYYVMLAAAALVLLALANIRDSKTGRSFFAVRGSEIGAASLGIDVTRTKLLAFAVSGFVAGAVGSLNMVHNLVASPSSFDVGTSLLYLSIAVVGGLGSLGGAVAAGVLFASLQELFFRVEALAGLLQLVSAALLAAALLFFPSGLAGIPARLRAPARRARSRHLPGAGNKLRTRRDALGATLDGLPPSASDAKIAPPRADATLEYVPGMARRVPLPPRPERAEVMSATNITVRFGGLTAVEDASIEVRAGEIVGLIGPNGAGKTTLFNAISGLNAPVSGRVHLFGEDVTSLPVHERARRGAGRTFQVIQLFPQISVFENLLVATHALNATRFFGHVFLTPHAAHEEQRARDQVRQVVDLLRLREVANFPASSLPFGTLRLVELARALVTGAPFVMLDEPVSGLDNAETDRFVDLLFWIRQRLGVSLLVIEHDIRMVTNVSDYVYVLDQGRILAEGTPAEIQRNAAVIAAYLGRSRSPEDGRPTAGPRGAAGRPAYATER